MTDNRRSPRAQIEVQCTLHRRRGSPITGVTRDIGPGGMCVIASRPLAIDEVMRFDVAPQRDHRIGGRARVLRQQDYGVYALRFEALSAEDRERLFDVARGSTDLRAR